jgi:hypothetical protein
MCHADMWFAKDGELLGARMLHSLINSHTPYTSKRRDSHASLSSLLLILTRTDALAAERATPTGFSRNNLLIGH